MELLIAFLVFCIVFLISLHFIDPRDEETARRWPYRNKMQYLEEKAMEFEILKKYGFIKDVPDELNKERRDDI